MVINIERNYYNFFCLICEIGEWGMGAGTVDRKESSNRKLKIIIYFYNLVYIYM
jgi:hypothetical protein